MDALHFVPSNGIKYHIHMDRYLAPQKSVWNEPSDSSSFSTLHRLQKALYA